MSENNKNDFENIIPAVTPMPPTPPKRSIRNIPLSKRNVDSDTNDEEIRTTTKKTSSRSKKEKAPVKHVEPHLTDYTNEDHSNKESNVQDKQSDQTNQIDQEVYQSKSENKKKSRHIVPQIEESEYVSRTDQKQLESEKDNRKYDAGFTSVASGITSDYPESNLDNDNIEPLIDSINDFDDDAPVPSPRAIIGNKRNSTPIKRDPAFESIEDLDNLDNVDSTPDTDLENEILAASRANSGFKSALKKKAKRFRSGTESSKGNNSGSHGSSFEPLHTKKRNPKKVLALIVLLLIIGITFAHTALAKTNISIKTSVATVDLSAQALPSKIPFQSFTKNSEREAIVSPQNAVSLSRKATGDVTIFNNLSDKPYDLVKSTRFETANGSIYRLISDISVPGQKTVSGKLTPGSVIARVEADKPGALYNAKAGLDLTLPGLVKGTNTYKKIYAKTASNFTGGTGGSTGNAVDTSSAEIQAEVDKQKIVAEQLALNEFTSQNSNMILLKDSIKTTTSIGKTIKDGENFKVMINVTTKAIGLDSEAVFASVSEFLKEQKIAPTRESVAQLDYRILETSNTTLLSGNFSVEATGTVSGNRSVDLDTLKQNLSGKPNNQAYTLIQQEIPNAEIEITTRPFWKSSIVGSPEKITITLE